MIAPDGSAYRKTILLDLQKRSNLKQLISHYSNLPAYLQL
jgi:hypothetical protein